MSSNTYLGNVLENARNKAKYDAQVKKILSDKSILAWILKYSVSEFRDSSISQIVSCIEGEPEVSMTPVYPGSKRAEAIAGGSTEDAVPNEGRITYDIRFHVVTPTKERIKMFINIEAQKKYHVGYDLVTRAIFYCARMLSAQLDTEFAAENYDGIKKVYSIWICMDVPEYAQNTITEYTIEQKKLFGDFRGSARYDLLSSVMVCIGKTSETRSEAPLHKLLATVLSEELAVDEKKKVLQDEYEIATENVEEVLNTMCNLSDLIEEKGIKRGIERGLEQGMAQGLEQGRILQLMELVEDGTITLEVAAAKAGISVEELKKRIEKCGI